MLKINNWDGLIGRTSLQLCKGLVTNYGEGGGLQNGRGGAHEALPQGGGAEKVVAMLKGGAQKVLG